MKACYASQRAVSTSICRKIGRREGRGEGEKKGLALGFSRDDNENRGPGPFPVILFDDISYIVSNRHILVNQRFLDFVAVKPKTKGQALFSTD